MWNILKVNKKTPERITNPFTNIFLHITYLFLVSLLLTSTLHLFAGMARLLTLWDKSMSVYKHINQVFFIFLFCTPFLKTANITDLICKCSHRRCSIRKGLQACNFIKKRLQHRYFPVNIPILKNIREGLVLELPQLLVLLHFQKQPQEVFCKKRCS